MILRKGRNEAEHTGKETASYFIRIARNIPWNVKPGSDLKLWSQWSVRQHPMHQPLYSLAHISTYFICAVMLLYSPNTLETLYNHAQRGSDWVVAFRICGCYWLWRITTIEVWGTASTSPLWNSTFNDRPDSHASVGMVTFVTSVPDVLYWSWTSESHTLRSARSDGQKYSAILCWS